jgi:hypothetical protein
MKHAKIFNLKFLKSFIIFFFILSFSVSASAEWKVIKRAQIKNKDKNLLRFERISEGPVRVWLIMKSMEAAISESKMPIYQVDNKNIHDLTYADDLYMDKGKNKWIRWLISDDKNIPSDDLQEIMNGTFIVFQFYLPDGKIKETIFNLKGAKDAIDELFK